MLPRDPAHTGKVVDLSLDVRALLETYETLNGWTGPVASSTGTGAMFRFPPLDLVQELWCMHAAKWRSWLRVSESV